MEKFNINKKLVAVIVIIIVIFVGIYYLTMTKGLKKSHFEIFKSSFSHHLLFDMPPKKGSQKLETTAPFR